ncbi:RNA polymerase sigma factor [Pedobacter sp. MW01-1-1]|uniref:RNA polymerase sigma factor n=1 Tax=Pedobacter sp. MW01-1-1 TaxID=3383027 RepID=UPI003FED5C1C
MQKVNYDILVDEELYARFISGDSIAFSKLYQKYSAKLYANALKLLKDPIAAEELIQELFTRVWLKRETLAVDLNFAPYLYRIAQNLVIDFFRRIQKDKVVFENLKKTASENYLHIEESIHSKEISLAVQKALENLSPQQRKVYELCKLEGKTYKQAAEELQISQHTVKEYVSLASNSVKKYLLSHPDLFLILLFLGLKA